MAREKLRRCLNYINNTFESYIGKDNSCDSFRDIKRQIKDYHRFRTSCWEIDHYLRGVINSNINNLKNKTENLEYSLSKKVYLCVQEISKRWHMKYNSIYQKLKRHGNEIKTRRMGKKTFYLVSEDLDKPFFVKKGNGIIPFSG